MHLGLGLERATSCSCLLFWRFYSLGSGADGEQSSQVVVFQGQLLAWLWALLCKVLTDTDGATRPALP